MDRDKFVQQVLAASSDFDAAYVSNVIVECINTIDDEFSEDTKDFDFEAGCKMAMLLNEECAELTEEIMHRFRGRTKDNYGILEESADMIINVLCVCMMVGIKPDDLLKAMMLKCRRAREKKHK